MVAVVGNGHGDQGSNPGRGCLHFPLGYSGKCVKPSILPAAIGK